MALITNFPDYTASAKLANVLMKIGIEETTERDYPKHFERMLNDKYKPAQIKRTFSFSPKENIHFDYTSVKGFGAFSFFNSPVTFGQLHCLLFLIRNPDLVPKKRQLEITPESLDLKYNHFCQKGNRLGLNQDEEAFCVEFEKCKSETYRLIFDQRRILVDGENVGTLF